MSTPAADPNAGLARIVVAAPMKSGSTHVSVVLATYFDVENPSFDYDWEMEHALTETVLAQLRGRTFSINLHMFPHRINAEACNAENIWLVVLWRNLADMIVSADDHRFGEGGRGPGMYVMEPQHYAQLDEQARFRFLIDTLAAWYVSFYLKWRRAGAPMYAFERMIADPRAFFVDMMERSLRHQPLIERLDASIAVSRGEDQRVNVGRVGRSAEKLSDENKRRLERRLLTHPDVAQLEILLWELPWEVPALVPQSPFDGQVVRTVANETVLFVSRGVAYPVNAAWLASRTGERRVPRIIDDAAALNALPRGEPLL